MFSGQQQSRGHPGLATHMDTLHHSGKPMGTWGHMPDRHYTGYGDISKNNHASRPAIPSDVHSNQSWFQLPSWTKARIEGSGSDCTISLEYPTRVPNCGQWGGFDHWISNCQGKLKSSPWSEHVAHWLPPFGQDTTKEGQTVRQESTSPTNQTSNSKRECRHWRRARCREKKRKEKLHTTLPMDWMIPAPQTNTRGGGVYLFFSWEALVAVWGDTTRITSYNPATTQTSNCHTYDHFSTIIRGK